jgi:hypothetical protein
MIHSGITEMSGRTSAPTIYIYSRQGGGTTYLYILISIAGEITLSVKRIVLVHDRASENPRIHLQINNQLIHS